MRTWLSHGMACAKLAAFVALVAAVFPGCERTAGTEVGNPTQVVVTASFRVDQPSQGLYMKNFALRVLCVQYTTHANESGELWAVPGGSMVDLMDSGGASVLPPALAKGGWRSAELSIAASDDSSRWTDSMEFESFAGTHYVKAGTGDEGNIKLLVEIPKDMSYKLHFYSERMQNWTTNDSLQMAIHFDCEKWFKDMDFSRATVRVDATGQSFHMISKDENSEMHAELMQRFPYSFNADSVAVP